MKTITFAEAQTQFAKMFELAANGELIVISKNNRKVAIQSYVQEIAPPGYFADDYDADDVRLMNAAAAEGPQTPLP